MIAFPAANRLPLRPEISRASRRDGAIIALQFMAGFAWLFRRFRLTGFEATFGDEGDGEILLAIVAHWDHVFKGAAVWQDPNFFYPVRGALGFTDALFLYGAFHAVLRAIGADTFLAFMGVQAGLPPAVAARSLHAMIFFTAFQTAGSSRCFC